MKEFKKYLAQAESYLEQGNTIEATRSLGEAEEIVETALQRRWGDDRAEKKQMFEEHLKPLRDKIETKD